MPNEVDVYSRVVDTVVAAGTLLAVIVAVLGERIHSWLFPIRVRVALNDGPGSLTFNAMVDQRVLWLHLKVTNESRTAAKHCRVLMVAIERSTESGFVPVAFPVPFQLPWAPQLPGHEVERAITLTRSAVVDFGQLIPAPAAFLYPTMPDTNTGCFIATFHAMPNDFAGVLKGGEACRYTVEVHAENVSDPPRFTFEVSWDGCWGDGAVEIRKHLLVHPVRTATLRTG